MPDAAIHGAYAERYNQPIYSPLVIKDVRRYVQLFVTLVVNFRILLVNLFSRGVYVHLISTHTGTRIWQNDLIWLYIFQINAK